MHGCGRLSELHESAADGRGDSTGLYVGGGCNDCFRYVAGDGLVAGASPNTTTPTESTSGSDAKIGLTFSDFLYASDTVGVATLGAGLYTSGIANLATNNIPVTNNSTRTYPRPIGAWVTEPGLRIAPSASQVVEFFAGHTYGQGGAPVAAVKFTAYDGTNSVSHTISSMTQSTRLWSTTCTATNGSNVLTGCGDTTRLIKGERVTVAGIPGQPEILSWTSTTITLGQTVAASGCTPKTNGEETITGTPGDGEGLGDGAFVGALISDPTSERIRPPSPRRSASEQTSRRR